MPKQVRDDVVSEFKNAKRIYDLHSLEFLQNGKLNVGILGGSFNPPHEGHLKISIQALKQFEFDYIIWLIAYQNPDKEKYKDDIFVRAKNAADIVSHPRILVSTAEYDIGSKFIHTYYFLRVLTRKFNKVSFTWLMGSDNLKSFHKWHRSSEFTDLCNIIIFDRPGYKLHPNSQFQSKFYPIVARQQLHNRPLRKLISGSQIRGNLGAQNRSVLRVHEDLAAKLTLQLTPKVEFPKKFNIIFYYGNRVEISSTEIRKQLEQS